MTFPSLMTNDVSHPCLALEHACIRGHNQLLSISVLRKQIIMTMFDLDSDIV